MNRQTPLNNELISFLPHLPLFRGLSDSELADVAAIAVEKPCPKGRLIFNEGDTADGFYAVISGQVKVFKLSPEGKEHIFHIFGSGAPFGEVAVFEGGSFPASAMALKKSRLLFFPRTAFIGLISENPSMSLNMMAVLSRRLRMFTLQVESLALKEVPQRLGTYLRFLLEEQGGGDTVHLPIAKGHLASLLGTTPETLSRILTRMKSEGVIEMEGRQIRMPDPDLLVDIQ